MDPILDIQHISKKYRIGAAKEPYLSLRESLGKMVKFGGSKTKDFYALRDVNLQIGFGETIGIIGKNGAGKSTLLKILSKITFPTEGKITARGRVASLLEVGTGFHPELTGRENIFLNGSILGLTRKEILSKFDEIVEFSGVEPFLETPLKRFSSGMSLRLAFAVAAHLEPEILVIDEVLAVGDAEFQKKCLGKMSEVSRSGRTIIFVSHDMQAISTLTQRCLYLENGQTKFLGSTREAIDIYLSEKKGSELIFQAPAAEEKPSITKIELHTSASGNVHVNSEPLKVKFTISVPEATRDTALSFQFFNFKEQAVVHLWVFDTEQPMCREKGEYEIVCEIPKFRLYMGKYYLTAFLSNIKSKKNYQVVEHVCPMEVEMFGMKRDYQWVQDTCVYLEDNSWKINKL